MRGDTLERDAAELLVGEGVGVADREDVLLSEAEAYRRGLEAAEAHAARDRLAGPCRAVDELDVDVVFAG